MILLGAQIEQNLFIANKLVELSSEFILRTNMQWIGTSKGMYRSLQQYDAEIAKVLVDSFDIFYRTNEKKQVIQFVDDVLQPHGGRLFEGFSLGEKR